MVITGLGLKSIFLFLGVGCTGCVNLFIPKLINKRVSAPPGPYVVAQLGESHEPRKYELFIIGDKIFTNVGEWLRFSDLNFEIEGKALTGGAKLFTKDQDYCLESENDNLMKWCWKNSGGSGGSAYRDSYASQTLGNLIFKFNFENNTYFPKDRWDYEGLKVSYNYIGNSNCKFETASLTCTSGIRQFDLIRGEII